MSFITTLCLAVSVELHADKKNRTDALTEGRVKNIILPSATGCMGYNYAYSYLINMQTAFFYSQILMSSLFEILFLFLFFVFLFLFVCFFGWYIYNSVQTWAIFAFTFWKFMSLASRSTVSSSSWSILILSMHSSTETTSGWVAWIT